MAGEKHLCRFKFKTLFANTAHISMKNRDSHPYYLTKQKQSIPQVYHKYTVLSCLLFLRNYGTVKKACKAFHCCASYFLFNFNTFFHYFSFDLIFSQIASYDLVLQLQLQFWDLVSSLCYLLYFQSQAWSPFMCFETSIPSNATELLKFFIAAPSNIHWWNVICLLNPLSHHVPIFK